MRSSSPSGFPRVASLGEPDRCCSAGEVVVQVAIESAHRSVLPVGHASNPCTRNREPYGSGTEIIMVQIAVPPCQAAGRHETVYE